jgi:hypothetical protein
MQVARPNITGSTRLRSSPFVHNSFPRRRDKMKRLIALSLRHGRVNQYSLS